MKGSVCSERTSDFDPYDPDPANHIALAIKLAAPVARKMRQETLDSDAFSDALYGLFRASLVFDREKGVKFVTYAYHSVKHAIAAGVSRRTQSRRTGFEKIRTKSLNHDIGKREPESISSDVVEMIPEAMECCLNEREQQVVRMWLSGLRFEDIGQHFGFSKQRAEQIRNAAVRKLRAEFESRGVTELEWEQGTSAAYQGVM